MPTPSTRLRLVTLAVAVALLATNEAIELSLDTFHHHTKLHPLFSLSWTANSSYIVFKIQVETSGYVGFGVSRKGGMKETDMVVCGADRAGNEYRCTDRYSVSETTPVKDDSQDVHIFNLNFVGKVREVTFGRKLRTEDKQDVDITHDTMRVVFAFGSDAVVVNHGPNRGTKSVLLLSYSPGQDKAIGPSDTTDLLTNKVPHPHTHSPRTLTTHTHHCYSKASLTTHNTATGCTHSLHTTTLTTATYNTHYKVYPLTTHDTTRTDNTHYTPHSLLLQTELTTHDTHYCCKCNDLVQI